MTEPTSEPGPETTEPTPDRAPPWPVNARLWTIAGVFGATAVILGALGAHALESVIETPSRLNTWEIGTRYHLAHALALLIAALHPGRPVWAPRLIVTGIVLFSGSLYAIALTGISTFGVLTPFGGLFLISGWFALAAGR